jgi:hypothetical protein
VKRPTQTKALPAKTALFLLAVACLLPGRTAAEEKAAELKITELHAASGKTYEINEGGFVPGGLQFVDRDYQFNYVPQPLKGLTTIKTAGNDKLIPEDQPCLSFRVNVPVTVYVLYGDKLRFLPSWLAGFSNTRWKATRQDTNPATLKGLFTLFAKDFPPGVVILNGNLSKQMAQDEEFQRMKGSTFCMYSVVVAPKR